MSIQDFLEEAQKRASGTEDTPARKEVFKLAMSVYHDIKDGKTEEWVKRASRLLIQSIAPDLSSSDKLRAMVSVEGIAVTVLCELFDSGVIIKREEHKDETREQS